MPAGRFSAKIFPGARFGKLTVVERIPRTKTERSKVRCICDCGKEVVPNADNLASGNSKSCGCEKFRGLAEYVAGIRKFQVGDVFGRLTVVQVRSGKRRNVVCQCTCGSVVSLRSDCLGTSTNSCGCLNSEIHSRLTIQRNKDNAKWNGLTADPKSKLTYKTWRALLQRLAYDKRYDGVLICERLFYSPWGIVTVIGHRPTVGYTIDRFPIHDGDYTCGRCVECIQKGWKLNVRWASRKEQAENRGDFNVKWTAFGKTLLKSQWVKLSGISEKTLFKRVQQRGWSIEKALSTPDDFGNHYRPSV